MDEQCLLMHDKYPKARRHALVIARTAGLDGPSQLGQEHLPLLRHMQASRTAWCVS